MHSYINQKVLLTSQNWFYAPDGKQYKAVWGTLKGIHEAGKTLGFIPNRSHANWFLEIEIVKQQRDDYRIIPFSL